jgi:hypothetical protein
MFDNNFLETIKVVLEIAALIFLPIVAYTLRAVVLHGRKIDVLEEKVNADINRRLDVMERKLDSFDNKIEQKIDKLENNLNAKIDIMTGVLTSFTSSFSNTTKE